MTGMRRTVWCLSDERGRVVDGLYGSESDAKAALRDYLRCSPPEIAELRVSVVDPDTAQWLVEVEGWEVT